MRDHRLKRAFAALVLLWFVVATTQADTLHRCSVHGASVATTEHGGGAGHSHHAEAPADDEATCSCVGDCSAGGFSVAISGAEQRLVTVTLHDTGGSRIDTDAPKIAAPAFFLPYANGPPELRTLA